MLNNIYLISQRKTAIKRYVLALGVWVDVHNTEIMTKKKSPA